jgi:hypothetical protein
MRNTPSKADPKPSFPAPTYFGKNRHWKLSDLLHYEAELAGLPFAEIAASDEIYLTAAQVRKRYGNVSDMWLSRRLNHTRQESQSGRAA